MAVLAIWLSQSGGTAVAAEYDCVIEPKRVVELRTPVEGIIETVTVDRGDFVGQGDVLVRLESGVEEATADLAQFKAEMEGAIRSAQSRVEFAQKKLKRFDNLQQQRFASDQERDEAVTEQRLAEAQLQEAMDNRRIAELEHRRALELLKLREIRSPLPGLVIERLMHPGEVAETGDARRPILKIAEIDTLYVEVIMPSTAFNDVGAGMPVDVIPEAPLQGKYAAKVRTVDRVFDAASGTFGVRLELPNPDRLLPAGVKCTAEFAGIVQSAQGSP
jgi:RND family efflux transporter MFP subunit